MNEISKDIKAAEKTLATIEREKKILDAQVAAAQVIHDYIHAHMNDEDWSGMDYKDMLKFDEFKTLAEQYGRFVAMWVDDIVGEDDDEFYECIANRRHVIEVARRITNSRLIALQEVKYLSAGRAWDENSMDDVIALMED